MLEVFMSGTPIRTAHAVFCTALKSPEPAGVHRDHFPEMAAESDAKGGTVALSAAGEAVYKREQSSSIFKKIYTK